MSAVIVIAIRETGAECARVVSATLEQVLRGIYMADEGEEKKEGGAK